jgi:LmbE family N-acetylglucosaminyl deacetylase
VRAGHYFDLVRSLPIGDWRDLTDEKPFVVISPHPDDESLGAGGLIALARRYRQEAVVILLTDGSGSHPKSRDYPRERLIQTRRSELREAAQVLGLTSDHLHELGLPDTAAPTAGPTFDKTAQAISDIITKMQARSLFVTWKFDPHCDHEAAALLAEQVRRQSPDLKLWAYPIWGWHLSPSAQLIAPIPHGIKLAIDQVMEQKRAAIDAHRSQMGSLISDDPNGFCFTDETLKPFLQPYEYFIEVPTQQ